LFERINGKNRGDPCSTHGRSIHIGKIKMINIENLIGKTTDTAIVAGITVMGVGNEIDNLDMIGYSIAGAVTAYVVKIITATKPTNRNNNH
tara:strand:+ start:499 stop:771 length:273 start_codon:yes stop_codon:yes gene_type:complete